MTANQNIPDKGKDTLSSGYLTVKEGLEFILEHFDTNALFPRTIMTKKLGYQRVIYSKEEALKFFKDSGFIDCRINAFPALDNPFPDFIFIDLDTSIQDKISIDRKLKITLLQIHKRLEGSPTVLWTGNGYHIYQPLDCKVRFENIQDFNEFGNCNLHFLKFAKVFFSRGYADNSNNPSLRSCLLRVPNSINSKCLARGLETDRARVRLVNKWDAKRPSIGNMMGSFYAYLISYKIKSERRQRHAPKIRYTGNKIQWIEKLLQTPLEDHRKYCLFRILVPYLLNFRKLSVEESSNILESWLSQSNKLKRLDFNPRMEIKNRMRYVKKYRPLSFQKLKTDNKELYQLMRVKEAS